jgi:hypothetical protein
MSAINLPITALRFAGQGLGLAGRGAMEAARFGGRTMVSPGMIGSMARWTAASMVLSSLPNPAARKQTIDKALHEANRAAEREYISLRGDMKRNNQLRKREREFQYTQRIADARFLANPEERNFQRRMADIDKKYDETLQKIEEVSLKRQQDLEESQRIMASRRDVSMVTRYGEDIGNFGKGVYNTGVGAVQGAAGLIDLLTFGATNLHGTNADWEKKMSAKNMTMVIPKEWTDKYGQMDNKEVNLSDNAGYKIASGVVKAWGKTAKDLEKAQEEIQKLREGMERNHMDAMQKQAQSQREDERRHAEMKQAMETAVKSKQLGILDIETDTIIKDAQLDAVLKSRFTSPEQKMYAKMEKEALAEQTAISLKYNGKRNEMVDVQDPATEQEKNDLNAKYRNQDDADLKDTKAKFKATGQRDEDFEKSKEHKEYQARAQKRGQDKQKELEELNKRVKLAPATEQEKVELDAKYQERDDAALQEAKDKYESTRQKNADAEMAEYMDDWKQRKAEAMEKATTGGLFGTKISRPYSGDPGNVHTAFAREYDAKRKEVEQKSQSDFTKSEEYKEYQKGKTERDKTKQEELDGLNNRKELRKRGDIEGRAIDNMEAVEQAQFAMKFEERKRMVQAAMQLPVRSNLEESYNMVNDELMKQGEAQRLWGGSEVAKVIDESIKPALEQLDRHYEKLERVLQSGEVRATVQVKM